jgi:glycosyltransferase involved in cell wall biosynthesis
MKPPCDISAPIPVLHLTLDAQPKAPPPAPGFSVYWRDDVPVGAVKAFNADVSAADCTPLRETIAPLSGQPLPASVIICTRDRPDQLARCLLSLKDQTLAPTEIIVVDNASIDERTRSVALDAGVRYVREDKRGLSIARNSGAAAASCPIVVYTDDDTALHPTWLQRMVASFDEPAIWAVTGQVLPAELETAAQAVFEKAWGLGKGYERRDYGPAFYEQTRRRGCPVWGIGAGASTAFRREVFDRLGGFDERLGAGAAGCSEDSEYWHRILCAGGVCRYEPAAVIYHYHRRDFEGLARQLRAYMRGHVAALLVQYERSGELGNLRRLLKTLPRMYARKLSRRLTGVHDSSTCLVGVEILGVLEGVAYYLASRVKAGSSSKAPPSIVR